MLYEFVRTFICSNSLIRLWYPHENGYKMICNSNGDSVCMEHEFLKGESWQWHFKDFDVIGIKDIVVDDDYREAINIIIDVK